VSGAGEQMVTIACESLSAGGALEGLFLLAAGASKGAAVIAPPHPLYGGSMENAVVSELAYACARAGLGSLRFNWRGVGASAGTPSGDPRDAAADYAAAVSQLRDTIPGPLVLCGYSFGAAAAVAQLSPSGDHSAQRLLLVAPPPGLLDLSRLHAFRGQALLITGQHDRIAPPSALQGVADELAAGQLVVVPKADHFFSVGLAQLSRESAAWLEGLDAAGHGSAPARSD